MTSEVLFRRMQNMQTIILNRPEALNALNLNMVKQITPKLKVFEESPVTKSILLTGEGSRAFCAGGDIKALVAGRSKDPKDVAAAVGFMQNEYELNHYIGTIKKPFISLMNGISMGGGVGLSVHAPFRIATENTVFAMPETNIGLFPDVGGSFFLPRLDGEVGTFLGMTGQRLKGVEVFMAGIATHYVPSERLPALLERLGGLESDELEVINAAIEEFVAEAPGVDAWNKWALGGENADAISRCFSGNTLEEIVAALEKEGSAWAKNTLATLKKMSPTSLKLTLEQLRRGRNEDFATCFRMEYRMVQETLQNENFFEGVTARLVEKRDPVWSPSWDELSSPKLSPQEITTKYFTKRQQLPPSLALIEQRLNFVNDLTYYEYPHRTLSGLPTDRDIKFVLESEKGDKGKTLDFFVQKWGSYSSRMIGKDETTLPRRSVFQFGSNRPKIGLVEKVESILARAGSKL